MQTLLKRIGCDEYKIGNPSDPANDWWIDVSRDKECRAIAAARGIRVAPQASAFEVESVTIEIEEAPYIDKDGAIEIHTPEPEPVVEDVPVFFEPKKKATRVTKPKKAEDAMLIALRDVGNVAKKSGDEQATCVMLSRGFVVAHTGILTIGVPFGFDFHTVVSYQQLIDAKRRSGDEFAATALDDGALSVVAGELTMRVSAAQYPERWRMEQPDSQIAPATDRLRDALIEASTFATDKLERPEIAGLMLQDGSVVGTNGFGIVEAWHGINMPPNQRIPVAFAKLLAKVKRPIVGFGFSDVSFTVWFADGGFIRTAKHQPEYCKWQQVFEHNNGEGVDVDLPESFFKALDAIRPFCNNDVAYFVDGDVCSRRSGDEKSVYRLSKLPFMGFNTKLLGAVKKLVTKVTFYPEASRMMFVGNQVRGCVMGVDMSEAKTIATPQGKEYVSEEGEVYSDWDAFDDDIPF